jgi:hypothetical protein
MAWQSGDAYCVLKGQLGAIVGSKRGEMCERAHALMGKGAGMVKETFVFRNLCASSRHQGGEGIGWKR